MPSFVVLLRGVNVGKARRVPMAEFRDVLLGLGCTSAVTLLNSGNAVVRHAGAASAGLRAGIAAGLQARFGFDVPVIVKSAVELDAIVSGNSLVIGSEDHSRLLVALAQHDDEIRELQPVSRLVAPPERFLLRPGAAYLHCAGGILESKAAAALLGRAGAAVTSRNWATILKLHALAHQWDT